MIRPRIQATATARTRYRGITKDAARNKSRRELTVVGETWVRDVRNIVRAELPRRDGVRHKTNTTHLEESFTFQVEEGPDHGFPMTLHLTIKPGVSAAKIGALEYGNPPHEITARNTTNLRWGQTPPELIKPFQTTVNWNSDAKHSLSPPQRPQTANGYGFMRRARRTALRRRGF